MVSYLSTEFTMTTADHYVIGREVLSKNENPPSARFVKYLVRIICTSPTRRML